MTSTTAGNSHIISNMTFGADAAGVDLKVFGDTTGYYLMWDASANKAILYGAMDVGLSGTGYDVTWYGDTAGSYMQWDESDDRLEFVGAGIDIGACTTGIAFVGDMTTGISMPSALSATDAILIAGANADAIHISGANTVTALHISGDQEIAILVDVDASATDGLKIAVDDSMTVTTGINICRSGTTGICTTGISVDTDGTTAISVGSGFTGVDMLVLNGTASGYGIEISGTCTTADIILQNGATINNDAAGSLTITEDSITLVAAGASKLIFGGITDWGTGATGTLIDGTGYDWVSQTVGRVNGNLNSTAAAAAYHALSVTVSQTSSNSCFGTWTELYFSNSVSLAASDNYASVWAQVEGGTTVSAPTTAGDFMTAVYANVKMGATFTTGANSVVNGVRVKGEISTTTISHAGRLAAFECLTGGGNQPWDYGLYVANATTAIYVDPDTCTNGILIGAADTVAGNGLQPATSAPVGLYFDDGGVATAAWGECVTIGLLLPTASTGAAQTGFPCATHVYTLQRASITGPASANMCALNASYIVSNSSTLDKFDNWCVSAFNPNLNVDTGSTVASGTTLAAIAFSGNWPGTISGLIVPMCVSTSNNDWSAFLQFKEANGCYQDAAAGSSGHKYLKVYIGSTLYTIDMVTA